MAPKTVLITGCSTGGIGSALAAAFHARGFRVFATARSPAKMDSIAHLPNVTLLPLDVTSRASIDAAAAAVRMETGGTLDVLVNNAGMPYTAPALDADVQTTRAVFDVNFFGTVETTKAFAPLVVAARGTVVNVCSAAAHVTMPWISIYAASKAAQEQYSEGLRLELRPYGVRVLSVVAGGVATNMTAGRPLPDLPENSFFRATQAELKRQEDDGAEAAPTGMSAAVFAEKVVADVLRGATGRVYRGLGATAVRVISSLLPQFAQDQLAVRLGGDGFEKAL